MLEKIGNLFISAIMILVFVALIGVAVFGSVAGYKGFTDHRIRKDVCVKLLQTSEFDTYLRTCRNVDIIQIETLDGQSPTLIVLPTEE